jgi:glycosidase
MLLTLAVTSACVDVSEAENKPLTSNVTDWRDEIIYQLMVDRFANGDPNNDYNVYPNAMTAYHGGDYQGVIDNLDYLEELGVTALWISPVVKNVEEDAGVAGYHGYWTQNFLEVNPHFGDMAKLREMVDACHARGIKVILDIVTNHVGQLFYYDINRNGLPNELVMGSGSNSPITRTTEWDPDFDSRGIQSFTSLGPSGLAPINWVWMPEINRVPPWPPEFANNSWYNRMGRVTVWGRELDACLGAGVINQSEYDSAGYWRDLPACEEYVRLQEVKGDFPGGLKDVRTELPEVQKAMAEVFAYWIEKADFDAFRIDTLKHVEYDFWKYFCPEIRRRAKEMGKQNFFMFGEAFDGYDPLLASYTTDEQVDSVFYFSQKFQAIDGVFKYGAPTRQIENLWRSRLPSVAQDNSELIYGQKPNTDGPVDAEGNGLAPYQLLVNFIDNHDLPRFLFEDDGAPNVACAPESGCNSKLCANDDWKSSNFCATSEGQLRCDCDFQTLRLTTAFLLTIDGIPCIYYGTEQNFNGGNDPQNREDLWRSGFDTNKETFKWTQRLIRARKDYEPLRRGDLTIRWSTENTGNEQDAGIFAFERSYNGETVLVVMNTSRTAKSETSASQAGGQDMQVGFSSGTRLTDVLSDDNKSVTVGPNGKLVINLDPQTVGIWVVQ